MGVTGLWKLIEPCGKPVPVETLEGKVLAVDISIWLHQVVKGFQDNKGAALNNAHLLGLFHRLCKLMYYRVKPVFVFDGCVPQLKKDTIARRQQQRNKLNTEADRIQALLLQSLAKEKVVQQALGSNADLLLKSPVKNLAANKAVRKEDTLDDMFKLPELPSCSKTNRNDTDETTDESFNENSFCSEDNITTSASADDSSFEESNSRNAYNSNIQAIDVKSKEFQQLPADVRHEILVDIKETRKQSSWGRLHELPSQSDDFSNFQMKRLLKRRDVQVSLEVAEQEMGGRTLTYAELTNIFSEEGILETDIVEKRTKQITSDEHTRFLLVKDLKQRLAKVKEEPIKEEKEIKKQYDPITKSIKNDDSSPTFRDEGRSLGNEYDADLELAIALSLEDDSNRVYDKKDYEYDSDESLKLSKAQRQQLQNAAKGPARSYMIEYAGMNKEEVAGILERTQDNVDLDNTDIERLIGGKAEAELQPSESTTKEEIRGESQDIRLCITDSSDGTDSDLEEVQDNDNFKKYLEPKVSCKSDTAIQFSAERKNSNEIQSELDEIKDGDSTDTDTDLEEVEEAKMSAGDISNKTLHLEDECVIEETPPCLVDEEEVKTKPSKSLNIEIDLTKPLEPKDDLFADIFEDIQIEDKITEKSPDFTKDQVISNGSMTEEDCTALVGRGVKESKSLISNDDKMNLKIETPSKTKEIISILDDLKHEANDIKNIRLENIRLCDSFIEISDDEAGLTVSKCTNEVIEVCDSDENEKRCSTPPSQPINSINHSPNLNTKSPNYRTPNKNHSITEFFNVNYVVKRTPDKPEDKNEEIPKVKSPFFVQRSPRSGRKSGTNSPSLNRKQSNANKTLFDNEVPKDSFDKLDNDFLPLKEEKPTNEEDILNEAADILKSQKTAEELTIIASDLAKERQELENERNRQDRMGMSITQRMNSDCQDLLRIFGVPFIVAPMEAEAQCAFLDIVELTNGTITDDSDIWLFGGRTVYKNFFAQNKHVMEFRSEQIEKDFNCDRKKLIQLACLVGSDYTTGIHGIGAVTALEVLASFTPKETSIKQTSIQNILDTLQKFRNWWQSFKSAAAPPGSSARLALQKKLKNIELHDGFPSTTVVEAYLTPKVDENKDTFSWGYPDVESLREFARKKFGWTTSKTDEILAPVLKKLNEKRTQQSIRNYFNVKNALSLRQIRVSKRVQNAIEKMSGDIDRDEASGNVTKVKRSRKAKSVSIRKKKEESEKVVDTDGNQVKEFLSLSMEASTSNQMARGPVQRATKRINIPETKEIIPQREKYLAKIEANKKEAAEIFKNTAKDAKKNRKI